MASNVKYVDFECEENAIMPYKKYSGDAGWDLFVSEDCDIPAGETVDVHTGIKIHMPRALFARITGRSSSLRKHKLLVNEGIIDNGYTGEMFICVHNLGTETFHVEHGMRLAQILFHQIEDVRWSQVDSIGSSSDGRGDRGFGSTGV